MKILILTTNTPHHIYFVREISMRHKLSGIIVEENSLIPPFDIDHPFEKLRDSYEKKVYTLPKHLDEEVARLHLSKIGSKLTKMTADQSAYTGIPQEGPFKNSEYRY